MSARQLRARLDRLTPASTDVIGQDRREELHGRKLSPAGLTEPEKAEYTKLEGLFREDQLSRSEAIRILLGMGLFAAYEDRKRNGRKEG